MTSLAVACAENASTAISVMGYAGKHAAEILTMSLEGFMDSRRILTTLAFTGAGKTAKPSAGGVSKQRDDYQALDRMVAQNTVAIKVRNEIQRSFSSCETRVGGCCCYHDRRAAKAVSM